MQLFVRTLSGSTSVVEADPRETVAELKSRGLFAFGAPAHALRLTALGRELDDDRTLEACGLSAHTTLHATLRLRGGAPTHVKLISKRVSSLSVVVRTAWGRERLARGGAYASARPD